MMMFDKNICTGRKLGPDWLRMTLCAVSAAGLFAGSAALAQDAQQQAQAQTGNSGVEEIVVTARQRSENQVEVPISIQAFTKEKIDEYGIHDLNSLQFQAGFTFQEAASTQAGGREFPALIFRGLQSTYGGGQDNSGSLFVDGIYISAGQGSIDTSDVKQIEVLKGPQNVYFGKNTFGGAVNFITENPSDEFKGSVETSGTVRGGSDFVGSVEGPLLPSLLDGRLTVQDYDKPSQYKTSDGGDLGKENTVSITGTLYATPTDKLWIRFRGHYQQDDDSAADLGFLPGTVYGGNCNAGKGTNAAGTPVPIALIAPYFCGSIPSLAETGAAVLNQNTVVPAGFLTALSTNNFPAPGSYLLHDPVLAQVPSLDHSGLRRNLTELSTQAGYELPYGFNAAFNAGYNQSESDDIWDLDRSANGIFINAQPIVSRDLTIDGRVTSDQNERLRGLLGATYFYSRYILSQDGYNFYDYAPLNAFFGGAGMSNYTNETDDTKAVYGSIEFDIFDWLTATAEARYQQDTLQDKTVTGQQYQESFNNYLPRYILKFHPEKTWDFYASYSEGVQPSQLQTGFINASAAQQTYLSQVLPGVNDYSKQASLVNWEVGAKQVLFDGMFEYGLALYDEKWNNQQTTAAVFNPAGCGLTQLTAACPLSNAGSFLYLSNDADIKGIEFSGNARITPQWTVDFSADYKHAIWLNYYNSTLSTFTGGVSHFNGNTMSRVPAASGTLASTYKDVIFDDWHWYVGAQAIFTGSMYESEINAAQTAAYMRVNASFGVTHDNVTVELYAKNLLDDKNWDFASRVPELSNSTDLFTGYSQYMGVLVQAPDRQDFGIKVRYKF
jgi:iron complex outermembrane receptor protein